MQTPDNEPQPFETPNTPDHFSGNAPQNVPPNAPDNFPPNSFSGNVPPVVPRKSSPLKWIGCGCGGCAILVVVALIALAAIGNKVIQTANIAVNSNATSTAAPSNLKPYFGTWTGQDGTSLSIRSDGKGDFNGGNFKVQGGGIELDNAKKTLKISSFFGIGREWKVDKAPSKNGDATEMTLNGTVYRRSGGFDPTDSTSSTGTSSENATVPSNAEAVRLTKTTLLDFDSAVAKNNFNGFHSRISQLWQNQISAPELTKIFQSFVAQKIRLNNAVNVLSPTFSPAPSIDKSGILTLQGFYPSKPSRLTFRLRFVQEENAWKLIGIRVNVIPQNGAQ